MNLYSAYSLVSMLNGNTSANANQSGYPYSNNQLPGVTIPPFNRNPSSQQNYSDKNGPYFNYGNEKRPYNGWGQKTDPELNVDEVIADHSFTVLDHYNSDLNLIIDPDGYGAYSLTEPEGFCFCWAGARATYGVTRGKVFFEVHITENLPVVYGDNHQEADPHVVRLGWSVDSCCFQLGESENSFGYGGTGKFSVALKFSDYGERFGVGDVIGSLLDLQSHPPTISFTKNGHWFGTAYTLHNYPVGVKSKALFPHILTKNCRFKVNFGQTDAWFAPPPGFVYIDHVPLDDRVRGLTGPSKKVDCEMNMIVGLPGVGKTTYGQKKQKDNTEKRYNIIGTDTLIDKMRVMGLPRKRNYHGRWEVLIDKASKCLKKLFQIASRRKRNYILDQTNVYASARRNKMKHFEGFQRIAWVIVPEHNEFERRSLKRTVEDGKIVPVEAVLEMKANFKLPVNGVDPFDKIEFVELHRDTASVLVDSYVKEGIEKRPPREVVFRHDKKYQQHNMPSPACTQQPAQNKVSDSIAAVMSAVRDAINYPGIKVEPGTVKVEPGIPTNLCTLAAPVVTSNPDLYIPHVAVGQSTATAVKSEPTISGSNLTGSIMSAESQRREKETNKDNTTTATTGRSSSSTTEKKTDHREESRRHDRRDEHRHRSRSRSRSCSRSSSRYSDRSRHEYRHRSERERRDRHRSDRDRYRERERDRDRHRSHYRSDSHGRRRGSDGRYRDHRDDRDSSYHSDSNSRHSDYRYSESQSQNPKESTSSSKPPSPSNYQSSQKPDEGGSQESNWPQTSTASFTGQQCLGVSSDYESKDIDRRQIANPFDSQSRQDKSNFSELFGSHDVDYRMLPCSGGSSNATGKSQVLPIQDDVKPSNYKVQHPPNHPGESTPYSQSQLLGFPQVSQQLSFSRSVQLPRPPMPISGPSYPHPPNPGYYEGKNPNNFNNPNYYSSPYPERKDFDQSRFTSPNPSYALMPFVKCSTLAPDSSRSYPPEKDDRKDFNQTYPSAINQSKSSENQYGYPSSDERIKQDLTTRTGYSSLKTSPGLTSHPANPQPMTSLYLPYSLNKSPLPQTETLAADFPSGKDSDFRFETGTRNKNETLAPNKDNNNPNDSVLEIKTFSSMPKQEVASSPSNGSSASKSFTQTATIQLPESFTQDSYAYNKQSGSVPKSDYGSSQGWGVGDKGQDGRSSSFSANTRDIPVSVQKSSPQPTLQQQQGQWSERDSMNLGMPPPPPNGPPAHFGMLFPPNYSGYSGYPNMPPDMGRRYPF